MKANLQEEETSHRIYAYNHHNRMNRRIHRETGRLLTPALSNDGI